MHLVLGCVSEKTWSVHDTRKNINTPGSIPLVDMPSGLCDYITNLHLTVIANFRAMGFFGIRGTTAGPPYNTENELV